MAERGITLYVIACEPTLSEQYLYAVDFYRALCEITSGRMVPLLNASKLGDYIVGSAIETIETEALIGEFEQVILEDVYGQGKSIEDVTEEIQKRMDAKNVRVNVLQMEKAYADTEESKTNVKLWTEAVSIDKCRGNIKPSSRVADSLGSASLGLPTGWTARGIVGRSGGGKKRAMVRSRRGLKTTIGSGEAVDSLEEPEFVEDSDSSEFSPPPGAVARGMPRMGAAGPAPPPPPPAPAKSSGTFSLFGSAALAPPPPAPISAFAVESASAPSPSPWTGEKGSPQSVVMNQAIGKEQVCPLSFGEQPLN